MSVEQHTLSNGATVLIDHMPHAQTVALSYMFQIGSRYETEAENGLAHFFEHMAFKGTKSRDVHSLAVETDDLGANSNAFTSKEVTLYYMHGMAEDIYRFNDIESDMARNLTLPADELEKERGVILEEIKRSQDNTQSTLFGGMFATMYPDQPYGRTTLGPSINIKNFDRETFDKFRQKHYHAGNLVVTVSGNVDPQKILKDIEQKIGDMPSGERSTYEPAIIKSGYFHKTKPENQVNLIAAFESSAVGHADNTAEIVMDGIMSTGMSSRLFKEIREKRSLVYSVSSGINRTFDSGFFYAFGGTSPEKVSQFIPTLCDELNKIRFEKVSDEELARAKKQIKTQAAMQFDSSPSRRMQSIALEYNKGGSIEKIEDFNERIDAITKDDVLNVAQKILSKPPTFASIGPEKPNEREEIALRMGLEI